MKRGKLDYHLIVFGKDYNIFPYLDVGDKHVTLTRRDARIYFREWVADNFGVNLKIYKKDPIKLIKLKTLTLEFTKDDGKKFGFKLRKED